MKLVNFYSNIKRVGAERKEERQSICLKLISILKADNYTLEFSTFFAMSGSYWGDQVMLNFSFSSYGIGVVKQLIWFSFVPEEIFNEEKS